MRKIPGPHNPSDMMTKHIDLSHIEHYMAILNLRFEEGRATIAQQLQSMTGKKSQSVGSSIVVNVKSVNAK